MEVLLPLRLFRQMLFIESLKVFRSIKPAIS